MRRQSGAPNTEKPERLFVNFGKHRHTLRCDRYILTLSNFIGRTEDNSWLGWESHDRHIALNWPGLFVRYGFTWTRKVNSQTFCYICSAHLEFNDGLRGKHRIALVNNAHSILIDKGYFHRSRMANLWIGYIAVIRLGKLCLR
jgi:hypothetical protein